VEKLNKKYCKWKILMMMKMIINIIIIFQINISLCVTG